MDCNEETAEAGSGSPNEAVAFAYEHYGRHVALEATFGSKTAWLKKTGIMAKDSKSGKRKAGSQALNRTGTVVLIEASGAKLFGDIHHPPFFVLGTTGDGFEAIRQRMLRSPSEAWMAVTFQTAGILPSALHLNRPGDEEVRYFNGADKAFVISRPKVLERVRAWLPGKLSPNKAMEILRAAEAVLQEKEAGRDDAIKVLRGYMLKEPSARPLAAAELLLTEEMDRARVKPMFEMTP